MATETLLDDEEVLHGYDIVSRAYPHTPPLSAWRAWEYAAYRHFKLEEPVLDIGCGDGRFFHLVWPETRRAVGIDAEPGIVELAGRSGVYIDTRRAEAQRLPSDLGNFASVFANCALEHFDELSLVLASIHGALRAGGTFLLSVVTDRWREWLTIPAIVQKLGDSKWAHSMRQDYEAYQHHVNALPPAGWMRELEAAGFVVLDHVPIVPELTSRFFLTLDQLWHLPDPPGELGDWLTDAVKHTPNFSLGFRQILQGILRMETRPAIGSGAVFRARKA
jgi:SAM-dependent methyltransferase